MKRNRIKSKKRKKRQNNAKQSKTKQIKFKQIECPWVRLVNHEPKFMSRDPFTGRRITLPKMNHTRKRLTFCHWTKKNQLSRACSEEWHEYSGWDSSLLFRKGWSWESPSRLTGSFQVDKVSPRNFFASFVWMKHSETLSQSHWCLKNSKTCWKILNIETFKPETSSCMPSCISYLILWNRNFLSQKPVERFWISRLSKPERLWISRYITVSKSPISSIGTLSKLFKIQGSRR
jgi:hypothetical protein